MVLVHQLEGVEHPRQLLGIGRAAWREQPVGDGAAALVLLQQHVDIGRGRPPGAPHFREKIGLLQLALVIVLAELAQQLRGALQRRHVRRVAGAQPGGRCAIDQDRAPDDAVLAHQVLDRADLLVLLVAAAAAPSTRPDTATFSSIPRRSSIAALLRDGRRPANETLRCPVGFPEHRVGGEIAGGVREEGWQQAVVAGS